MHIPTHILSGWCIANYLPLTPRQRLFSMVAATIPDIDGCGIFVSHNLYWNYHHLLAHNIFFAIISACALTVFSSPGRKSVDPPNKAPLSKPELFLLYFILFHLHLVLDYFGSGIGWPIHYLWPLSNYPITNPHAWEFFSWQNITAFLVLLAWTILIAKVKKRTPLELLSPTIERKLFSVNYQSPITT